MKEITESKIQIKMFGNFDIQYNAKSIFLETGSSIKSVEMLRFLLAQKDKLFTAEALAENVWPGNEYLNEKQVIRTYIHRLRKILTVENYFKKDFSNDINILNIKGGYKAEISENVEMDIELFEGYKDAALKSKDEDENIAAFEKVYKIYSGEFLEECPYDHWAVMFRNYYLRTFSVLACHILNILQENRHYSKMLDICEKSLKICELDENINIYFLQAMMESDQIANALKHYSFITSKMYTELSITPSERLRDIYSKLKAYKKQEDAASSLDISDVMDRRGLFNMINEIVKVYLTADINKYSVALINIYKLNEFGEIAETGSYEHRTDEEKSDIAESLKYSLEYALRKNDMYAVLPGECIAIAVLYDAKAEFYQNIINRITNAFYSRYAGYQYKIKIQISQVVTIN